jgi:predicted transcriptional regulator
MGSRSRSQGELEQAVLNVLWTAQELPGSTDIGLTSQQVLDRLTGSDSLALTTVLTVLSRLSDKGLVVKESAGGRSLLFRAATSRSQHDAQLLLRVFEGSQNPILAFSQFAQNLSPEQLAQLRQSLSGD